MQEEATLEKKPSVVRVRKPEWLKIRLGDNSTFTDTKQTSTTALIPSVIVVSVRIRVSAGVLAQLLL